jgi:hypothetical protein
MRPHRDTGEAHLSVVVHELTTVFHQLDQFLGRALTGGFLDLVLLHFGGGLQQIGQPVLGELRIPLVEL